MEVSIPPDQLAALARVAAARKVSLDAVVLEAVRAFLSGDGAIDTAFGIRPNLEDGLIYERRLRSEWDGR